MKFLVFFIWAIGFSLAHATTYTFGVLGDAGVWNSTTRNVRASLIHSKVSELILPGDNIYETSLTYHQIWNHWAHAGFHFPLVAIGNHHRSYHEEMEYFKMPSEFYAKVIGPARFIVLNSDNVQTSQEQANFLEAQLQEAQELFVFIVFHHPPFSLRHSWEERKSFHLATRPVLNKFTKKITSILVGHDHIASLVEFNSIPVIVSGAVWESFKIPGINYEQGDIRAKTLWTSKGQFFWTRLDINAERKEVWINFVEVLGQKSKVRCSTKIFPRPILVKDNCHLKIKSHYKKVLPLTF